MVSPHLGIYRNNAQASLWSIRYTTKPDVGEVFISFRTLNPPRKTSQTKNSNCARCAEVKQKQLKQRGAGFVWDVHAFGEKDPSEKEVELSKKLSAKAGKPKSKAKGKKERGPVTSPGAAEAGAAAAAAAAQLGAATTRNNKRRRSAGPYFLGNAAREERRKRAKGIASQAEDAPQSDVVFIRGDGMEGDYIGYGESDSDNDAGGAIDDSDDALYWALDNETPASIAEKLGLDLSMLLDLNKARYRELTAKAKLIEGTRLMLPPRGAGWYEALDDETPRMIAAKLGIDEKELVALNKATYKNLSHGSKMMVGTKLLLPGDGCAWTYTLKEEESLEQIAQKMKVDGDKLLAVNVGQRGNDIATTDEVLQPDTKILVPSGADSHFLARPPKAKKRARSTKELAAAKEEKRALRAMARAVTRISPPRRANIASDAHEKMHKLWDVMASVGDMTGRSRSESFQQLPRKHTNQEYYAVVQNPISLGLIRKKIQKKEYKDIDAFEEDMTLLFENARSYYSSTDEPYIDIEVLQDIFWEALPLIENGDEYAIQETAPVKGKRRRTLASESGVAEDEEIVASLSGQARKQWYGDGEDGEDDDDEMYYNIDEDSDDPVEYAAGPDAAGRQYTGSRRTRGRGAKVWRLRIAEDEWESLEQHFGCHADEEVSATLDRKELTRCALGDALAIYSLLRTIGSEIGLGVFLLEDFLCALASNVQNRLLSEVHMMVLRALNMPQVNVALEDESGESDHYLLHWLSINAHNWPELFRRYAELYVSQPLDPEAAKADRDALLQGAQDTAKILDNEEYWGLPTPTKVDMLRFLVDALYVRGPETADNGIQPHLDSRAVEMERRSAKGNTDDGKFPNCAVCGDGGELLCCDACACSFHVGENGCYRLPDGSMMQMPPEDDDSEWFCGFCAVKDNCATNLSPLGMHGDERFWFIGGHIFGEDCFTGAFHPKTKAEIEELIGRRVQKPDAKLVAGLKGWLGQIREVPIAESLCSVFRAKSGGGAPMPGPDGPRAPSQAKNVSERYLKPGAPEAHEVHWDSRTGGWWFYNPATKNSVWDDPAAPDPPIAPFHGTTFNPAMYSHGFAANRAEENPSILMIMPEEVPGIPPHVGKSIKYRKEIDWSPQETLHLLLLVRRDGVGDWGQKAKLLGGRRSANSIRIHFSNLNAAPAGGRPQPQFIVTDNKWPAMPAGEGKRGSNETSVCTTEHLKSQLFAIECIIPQFLMAPRWARRRCAWISSVHAASSGQQLAKLLEEFELAMGKHLMIGPWCETTGWITDFEQQDSKRVIEFIGMKKRKKFFSLEEKSAPAGLDRNANVGPGKAQRDPGQTGIDASNIVVGRRRRSVHNYSDVEESVGGGKPKAAPKKRVTANLQPKLLQGVLPTAFQQEKQLRELNSLSDVEICTALDSQFREHLSAARRSAPIPASFNRRKGQPLEWDARGAVFRGERWAIREHEEDRAVYRELDRSRIRKLARCGGIRKLSGFQYKIDPQYEGQSYHYLVQDVSNEHKKIMEAPPMINLQGAWRIQIRKARTLAAVELQLGCLIAAINLEELYMVDMCDRPMVGNVGFPTRGTPPEGALPDPERDSWMDLAVRSAVDSIVSAVISLESASAKSKPPPPTSAGTPSLDSQQAMPSAETKPEGTKPAEAKQEATDSAEAKPGQAEPEVIIPAEVKKLESTQPAETKPAEAKPAGTSAADSKSAESTKPAEQPRAQPAAPAAGFGVSWQLEKDEEATRRKITDLLRHFDRVRVGREQNQRKALVYLTKDKQHQRQREQAAEATSYRANWSDTERRLFELAVQMHGPRSWDAIARAVGSRNTEQIRTYSIRRKKLLEGKKLDPDVAHLNLFTVQDDKVEAEPAVTDKRVPHTDPATNKLLYTTMQINVPIGIAPGTICKIATPDTNVHFVTVRAVPSCLPAQAMAIIDPCCCGQVPTTVVAGQTFTRALPKQYDSVTLKTLDNAELRQFLHHRGIEQPESQDMNVDAGAERFALYHAALQYLDMLRRNK